MSRPRPHRCDERCVCPEDDKPLIYGRVPDRHACQDIDCKFGHGLYVEIPHLGRVDL